MATCRSCGKTFTAAQLVRHETERLVVVHCPDCSRPMGRYKRHGDRF
jgi:DNA-directed RNA polymerase subunit RPC12/RpoP